MKFPFGNKKMKNFSFRDIFSIFLVFFCFFTANARTVTFPVHGLMVKTDKPVPLEVEWDENWFLETPTNTYSHNIARIAALLSEISYVSVEKNINSNPLSETYRALGFDKKNIEWNYLLDYSAPITGNNQAAFSFANKDIRTANGTKKLVFVILRGTPLSANEWISNINVSDTSHKNTVVHEGFYKTVQNLHKSLIYYLLKNKISPDEAIFLITGHSRGAALANLLAANLEDEGIITGEQLFVYTFAAPNVSQEAKTSDPKYNFIWNIVNAEDIVPTVPPNRNEWKWKKFGQTKVLANYWNCDPKIYDENYIPRINAIFEQLLLRKYSPFKNGPFFQIQLARVLTTLYKTVEKYYGSVFGLRGIAETILLKTFPEKNKTKQETKESERQSALLKMIQKNMNSNITGSFNYMMNGLVDMHACETYLSFMLALDENEAFSDMGSSQIIINGSYDLAIYDNNGNLLCKILDGSLEIFSVRAPIAAMPFPNKVVIGFPENQNLNVILLKNSILPTSIPYKIEYYGSEGRFLGETDTHFLFPQWHSSIFFEIGEVTFAAEKLNSKRLSRHETKPLAKKYDLRKEIKFKIQPEISFTGNRDVYYGFRTGTQAFFFNFLSTTTLKDNINFDYHGFSVGIGHQHSLYGRILLDIESFNKFLWLNPGTEFPEFAVVPEVRLTLSYKPRHRLHFFAGCLFDFNISNFNDSAFTKKSTHKINERFGLTLDFNFGIRF